MSTRSVIARETPGGGFAGRYVHWDGYPSGVGAQLWELYRSRFGRDLDAMLSELIDGHPAGWSVLCADWSLPLNSSDSSPRCYCHWRNEPASELTQANAALSWCEYAYTLGRDTAGSAVMRILVPDGARDAGKWKEAAAVDLDGAGEADFEAIDRAVRG
jgi:hypothetical protein